MDYTNVKDGDHLFLILMNVKLGASYRDLSLRFNIKEEYASKFVRTWLRKLANVFATLIVLPACFNSFKNCVCIIDCTEIYIERLLT